MRLAAVNRTWLRVLDHKMTECVDSRSSGEREVADLRQQVSLWNG